MPNETPSNDSRHDTTGSNPSKTLSRRTILSGIGASGALLAGMGTASANGQGGQAVVHKDDYKPTKSFIITEVASCSDDNPKLDGSCCPEGFKNPDGSCWAPPLKFRCEGEGGRLEPGKGGALPFPYWHFYYVNEAGKREETPRLLYTRDNKVRTDILYRWPGGGKECSLETEGLWSEATVIQTGFTSDNDA